MRTFLTLVLLWWGAAAATAQGIHFTKGKFDEILSLAQKENKLVFIDAYTTWCAPCKRMSQSVFPKEKAGRFFNEHFVSSKFDMEKGEGKILAVRYQVKSFPTLLFLDSEGTLIHKVAGYQSVDNLIKEAKKALNPEQSLQAMEARYRDGDRSPGFLLKYMEMRYRLGDNSHGEIAEAYLQTQKDWTTPTAMQTIFKYTTDAASPMFEYMVRHKDAFYRKFGSAQVGRKIQQLLERKLNAPDADLKEIQDVYRRAFAGTEGERLASKIRATYYRRRGDRKGYALAVFDHYKKFPPANEDEMLEVGQTFLSAISNKKYLRRATKLLRTEAKANPTSELYLTIAQLYMKLKRRRKARKYIYSAMALAKAQDDELSLEDANDLMDKLDKM